MDQIWPERAGETGAQIVGMRLQWRPSHTRIGVGILLTVVVPTPAGKEFVIAGQVPVSADGELILIQ